MNASQITGFSQNRKFFVCIYIYIYTVFYHIAGLAPRASTLSTMQTILRITQLVVWELLRVRQHKSWRRLLCSNWR